MIDWELFSTTDSTTPIGCGEGEDSTADSRIWGNVTRYYFKACDAHCAADTIIPWILTHRYKAAADKQQWQT